MKKIMFNDRYGLTKAVLEGRKTMTRRIVKHPEEVLINWHRYLQTEKYRYQVGEVVAVAQKYKDVYWHNDFDLGDWSNGFIMESPGWNNKMFVCADMMPHQIRITNIRVERLQDISDEDCLREGILEDCPNVQYSFPTEIGYCGQYPFNTPRDAFAALIDKVSGNGTWESNPWVFVYEFELVK